MAINTVTVTTAANYIPEVWTKEISDAVQGWTGLADLVDRSFDDDAAAGDTVHIADMTNPSVRFKTADNSGTWDNTTETMDDLTINLQAYVAFLVEDITQVQAHIDVRSRMTDKIVYSLMSVVEGDITSGLTSLPDNFSQSEGALGQDVVPDDLVACVKLLDDADVPDADRFLYMSPGTHAALLKQNVFISGDYGQPGAVATGRIKSNVYGATPHVSTFASGNPATAGQSYSWFCHKRGVALVMQRTPMIHPPEWEPLEIGWGVVGDTIYGFTERLILPKTLDSTTPNDNFNVALAGN